MNYCVLTTINEPTEAVKRLYTHFGRNLIIVGDEKTPVAWNYEKSHFMFRDAPYAPRNHYARKNIGYIHAIQNKASVIYDTDDDNIPNRNWEIRKLPTRAESVKGQGWINVYSYLRQNIWPRGFSLKHINDEVPMTERIVVESYIQQGLSDGEVDVDAIWRLTRSHPVRFREDKSICLQPFAWCPFNSQSTWWFPPAYPLLYLPNYATFRMTDIWRSFVAQRCLWETNSSVVFHSPSEVFQERNPHDLLKDFESEIPGYLHNERIVNILSDIKLGKSVTDNLFSCYESLVNADLLPLQELDSVKAWIRDLS